jgi:hypothetical protein
LLELRVNYTPAQQSQVAHQDEPNEHLDEGEVHSDAQKATKLEKLVRDGILKVARERGRGMATGDPAIQVISDLRQRKRDDANDRSVRDRR